MIREDHKQFNRHCVHMENILAEQQVQEKELGRVKMSKRIITEKKSLKHSFFVACKNLGLEDKL